MHLTFESHIKEIPPKINLSFDMYVMTETLVGESLDQSMSVKDPRKNFHYSSFAASRKPIPIRQGQKDEVKMLIKSVLSGLRF